MAQIVINIPGDLSQAAADRFSAALPQGMAAKTGILALMKMFVRQKEAQNFQRQQQGIFAGLVQQKAADLANDPDVGGTDL